MSRFILTSKTVFNISSVRPVKVATSAVSLLFLSDQLRALTTPQWMNLGLDASIVDMLRQALSVGDDDYVGTYDKSSFVHSSARSI